MPTDPLTYPQAADVCGLSERHLYRLVEEGNGPPVVDSRISALALGEWFRKRIAGDDLQAEKTRLTKAQADRTELEVAELRGQLIRVEDAVGSWTDHVVAARAKLISLPSKVAPMIAAPHDIVRVETAIRAAIHEALDELAGDGLPADTRLRVERSRGNVAGAADVDDQSVGRRGAPPKPRKQRRARSLAD